MPLLLSHYSVSLYAQDLFTAHYGLCPVMAFNPYPIETVSVSHRNHIAMPGLEKQDISWYWDMTGQMGITNEGDDETKCNCRLVLWNKSFPWHYYSYSSYKDEHKKDDKKDEKSESKEKTTGRLVFLNIWKYMLILEFYWNLWHRNQHWE